MTARFASLRTAFAVAVLVLAGVRPGEAGCGCDKPPPPPAQVRPNVTYPGSPVTFFSPAFQAGQTYTVAFTSTVTGQSASVQGTVAVRRDLADGVYKPLLAVALPGLPPGPATIAVLVPGQAPAVTIADTDFTVAATPVALPPARGAWHYAGYQAAVGRDGVVYLALDITGLTEPMVVEAQAAGYPLRFGQEDVFFENVQGFLMQRLVTDAASGVEPMPGMFVYPAGQPATDSDKLHYSRHEFNTYFLQHAERQPHAVDPTDGNWHLDGSRHIDHDHLILAVTGKLAGGASPPPGATPPFDLLVTTYSLFSKGIVGTSSVTLGGAASTDSFDSGTGVPGNDGDVASNGTILVTGNAAIHGSAAASKILVTGSAIITGEWQSRGTGLDTTFMSIIVPAGIPALGGITLSGASQTIAGPGSFAVSSITLSRGSRLFIDNSSGPVTLYVTGSVTVLDSSVIDVADPKPEKFAVYVAGTGAVTLTGSGQMEGVVYAPASFVTIGGDAEMRGAVVGNALVMTSTSNFHYDSTLRGK